MPDSRRHRGRSQTDEADFGKSNHKILCQSVNDYSWLLSHNYSDKASLKLVCDHFQLTKRQRMAVMRSGCSDKNRELRQGKSVSASEIAGKSLSIDAFNILITIESVLGGGVILLARDKCIRDIAGLHGSYRKVAETIPAIKLIGKALYDLGAANCDWYFDKPVSNSGRLKGIVLEVAEEYSWPWQAEVVDNPDIILHLTGKIVVSSDGIILQRCARWFNLAQYIIDKYLPGIFVVDLR